MHKSDPKAGQNFDKTFDYDNNRIEEAGWTYDEDGRNVQNLSGAEALYRTFNAAGRLVRTRSDSADFRTYYDGDGDEIKRRTDTLNDETGLWDAQPTKYYIRSRVLGGRVVSEVWANGKKHRSFVKGIGNQTAVQSAYASETAQLNEVVLFEYSDASGMSYRTTNKLGEHAATGDGGEGSPIETDPLGGNIGTYTPFITLIEPFDPEYPELQTYNNGYFPQSNFSSLYASLGSRIADLPGFGTNWGSFAELGMAQYEERLGNSRAGRGFLTNEEREARRRRTPPTFRAPASPEERARLRALAATGIFDSEDGDNDDGSVWGAQAFGGNMANQAKDKLSQQECDKKIAGHFGGEGADAATFLDLKIQLGEFKGKTEERPDHLYKSGTFHIYTDEQGSADEEVGLYVPNGAQFVSPSRKTAGEYQDPINGEWKNEFVFKYNSGPYSGVSLYLVHVAGTYGGDHGGAFLGREFINSAGRLIGSQNAAKISTQIGFIGGLAGEGKVEGLNRHTHVVVKRNGKRIDPRKVFCGW